MSTKYSAFKPTDYSALCSVKLSPVDPANGNTIQTTFYSTYGAAYLLSNTTTQWSAFHAAHSVNTSLWSTVMSTNCKAIDATTVIPIEPAITTAYQLPYGPSYLTTINSTIDSTH